MVDLPPIRELPFRADGRWTDSWYTYWEQQKLTVESITITVNGVVTTIDAALGPTGVIPGVYGTTTRVAQLTIGADGRVIDARQIDFGVGDATQAAIDTAASNAISAHVALSDPHAQYLLESAATAGYQPLDSDLTAIAALTTTVYGRAFLALADAAAGRTALGLGTAATQASTAFDTAGAAAAAQAASQPLDSDLTAIAALTTATFGRARLTDTNATDAKTALTLVKADVGLGSVDNTTDLGKPISTATATALSGKQAASTVLTFLATASSNTAAAVKTLLALVKGDVGLGSVDNTADTAKPVSTAQQTALNLKADLTGAAFSGAVSATTVTASGGVAASGLAGFSASTYAASSRNPMYYFGNASAYGQSFFEGAAGIGGQNAVGIHFGTATAAGSPYAFVQGGTPRFNALATYTTNAAAILAGLGAGDIYKTITGELRIAV